MILAAGESRRAGGQKLLADFRGRRLIDYAIEIAAPWHPLVVASTAVARALSRGSDIDIVENLYPQRGMAYSLKLADAAIPSDASLMVFLGDKPLIDRGLIAQLCSVAGAAIVYPVHAQRNEPGHPVIFHPAARGKIASLPDGDMLHLLRDDPALSRCALPTTAEGAFFDIDAPPCSPLLRTE